jgi:hypothetical protein
VVEPRPGRRPRPSPLSDLLVQVATKHPDEDVRIREYGSAEAARVACYKLKAGLRGQRRPEGRWEFFYGPIADGPAAADSTPVAGARHGVWAHFYPPK